MNEAGERRTVLPTFLFQLRLRSEFRHVAKAKIRYRRYFRWNLKRRLERPRIENAHPAHAQRFGACRQPEILYRAHGRINVGRGIRLTAQAGPSSALMIAGNAKVHGRFDDGRQLKTIVEISFLTLINRRRLLICPFEIIADFIADGWVADYDEVPWLHKTDRWSMVRSFENAHQYVVGHGIREEVRADVAAFVNGSIEAALLLG